ncbi:MAG TPA: hypothetical protein VEQ58_19275, partial [Polyangiaceae bacterium]|nr:hypothetical protein [Polyangiaceae bacterium]
MERLDALTTLDAERAGHWAELFASAASAPASLLAAVDAWLHVQRGLPRLDATAVPLFQMLVGRWAHGERVAFEEGGRRYLFSELELLTARRAEAWSAAGVGPKVVVALGRAAGVELMLDLLAVLRLGACACWVAPLGEPYERAALGLAQPDFMVGVDVTSAKSAPKAKALDDKLAIRAGAPLRALPASYAPKDPCLLVFSPLRPGKQPGELSAPSPLFAGQLLRGLARDAAFVWCLRDGDRMAAPDWSCLRHQPFLALSAVSAGACFHFVTDESLPSSVDGLRGSYRALGVSPEARDALLQKPPRFKCELWFRELEASEPDVAWRRLA